MSTETTEEMKGGVRMPDGMIVPWERIGGVSEVAEQLTQIWGRPVVSGEVSTWAARHATNGFPEPLPIRVARGALFDLKETAKWKGPGSRWAPGASVHVESKSGVR